MAQEPESSNEISGQVSGNAWQIGNLNGDLNNSTVNNVHYPAAEEQRPELDFWLVFAAVIAVVNGLLMIVSAVKVSGMPLFGPGAVLDENLFLGETRWSSPNRYVAIGLGVWQIWSANDLFSAGKQARQRDRVAAHVALWMSFVPVYVAVGVPGEWIGFCLIAFAVALVCVLRGRRALRPRWWQAIVAGVIALATWYVPEVVGLWSDKAGASVPWALAGTLLLLVIVAAPVHAVLTAPVASAARTMRAWSFCLGTKLAITIALAMNGDSSDSVTLVLWLPLAGILAMLLASSSVRERASAQGA